MKPPRKPALESPILSFRNSAEWLLWLENNHDKSTGIWLKLAKKTAGRQTLTYEGALDAALTYGWIDSQKKSYDDQAWLQKFGPRGPRSIWSKRNREKTAGLIERGEMRPAGLDAVERAKKNGQWDAAYDGQRAIVVPEELRRELVKRPAARKFFEGLDSTNRYAILHRIQMAKKPETRIQRIRRFIEMLEEGRKIYP